MNRIFVANKPQFISSNRYLNILKRKYGVKKGGFSGTLDPFASGSLIVAFGQYTKLFQFLDKSKKKYRAVLWLGAISESLDLENFREVKEVPKIPLSQIENSLKSMVGEVEYIPPKFSAKNINGKRAYKLARAGEEFQLPTIKSHIYSTTLLNYSHPFISFEMEVSEGSYIRSFGQLLAKRLNRVGTLSYLHRVSEGGFIFDNEQSLNPIEILPFKTNQYFGDISNILNGKQLSIKDFQHVQNGIFIVNFSDFFSIIEIDNSEVRYLLNKILL